MITVKCNHCGTGFDVYPSQLKRGHGKYCSPQCHYDGGGREKLATRNRRSAKHRMEGTPEYSSWHAMRSRCLNSSDKDYANYGGRGITIDEKWDEFLVFFKDMGNRPEGTTLGRIDNGKGYSKENCQWETIRQQCANTRKTRNITYMGKTMCIAHWAKKLGVSRQALRYRINCGWELDDVFNMPMNHGNVYRSNRR